MWIHGDDDVGGNVHHGMSVGRTKEPWYYAAFYKDSEMVIIIVNFTFKFANKPQHTHESLDRSSSVI